jgi:hypothetical protein
MVKVAQGTRDDISGWAGVGVGAPNETPIHGAGTSLTTDNGWLVQSLWSGTASYVMYGMERTVLGIPGPGPMVWHGAEVYLPGEEITHMTTNALQGTPRLWIATIVRVTGGSGLGKTVVGDINLYYCTIPDTAAPVQDWATSGAHRFATSSSLYLPAEHWGDPAAKKFLKRYDLQADNLGTGRTIQVLAHAEQSSTFVDQGTAGGSPLATFYPPDDYLQARRAFFKLVLTGTTTNPPILRALKVRANVKLELSEAREYTVFLGGKESRSGAADRRNPDTLHDFLVSLQDSSPIPMQNHRGNEIKVIFEQGLEYSVINEPADGRTQEVCTFVVTVITRITETGLAVDTPDSPFRYDQDYTWGDTDGTSDNPIAWA